MNWSILQKRKNDMGIFKRLIQEWLSDSDNSSGLVKATQMAVPESVSGSRISFSVTPAHGGRIVEVHRPYREDHRGQVIRYDCRPHLITDEQDFANELAKLITMELLKES
jgi:hypothetical protein